MFLKNLGKIIVMMIMAWSLKSKLAGFVMRPFFQNVWKIYFTFKPWNMYRLWKSKKIFWRDSLDVYDRHMTGTFLAPWVILWIANYNRAIWYYKLSTFLAVHEFMNVRCSQALHYVSWLRGPICLSTIHFNILPSVPFWNTLFLLSGSNIMDQLNAYKK